MTYYESAKGQTITHERSLQELKRHGVLEDLETFYADPGKRSTYKATKVLEWLGY